MQVLFQKFYADPGVRVYHPGEAVSLPDLTAQTLTQRGIVAPVVFKPAERRETASRKRKKESR